MSVFVQRILRSQMFQVLEGYWPKLTTQYIEGLVASTTHHLPWLKLYMFFCSLLRHHCWYLPLFAGYSCSPRLRSPPSLRPKMEPFLGASPPCSVITNHSTIPRSSRLLQGRLTENRHSKSNNEFTAYKRVVLEAAKNRKTLRAGFRVNCHLGEAPHWGTQNTRILRATLIFWVAHVDTLGPFLFAFSFSHAIRTFWSSLIIRYLHVPQTQC